MNIIKFLLMALVLALVAPGSNAQEVSFAVSPPVQHVMVKPGFIIKLYTDFTNLADPTTAKISIQPLKMNQTTGKLEIDSSTEKTTPISIQSTLPINTPFTIKNKESKQTTFTVSIDPKAEEKDYYYSLIIQSQGTPSTEGAASIKLQNNLGSVLIFTVSKDGRTNSEINIPLFSIIPHHRLDLFGKRIDIFSTSDLIPIKLLIGNTGNNFTRIQGKIEISSNFGYNHQTPINDYLIYADSQTTVKLESSSCKDNTDTCLPTNSYTFQPKKIGFYTAIATIVDKSAGQSTVAKTEFIILPLKTGFIILYSSIFVIISYFYISRRHKQKK